MSIPSLKLISFALCPYVRRARIVLLEKGIEHEVEYLDPNALPPWFHDISPLGKVPVLMVDDEPLFESMVIVEYLDEITPGSLYPGDAFEKASNRSWIEFGNDILSTTFNLIFASEQQDAKKALAVIDERFDILEEEVLGEGPFFNGNEFGIVDAVYAPLFRYHSEIVRLADQQLFEDRPLLTAWSEKLLSHPSVVNSVPDGYDQKLEKWMLNQDSWLTKQV